MSIVLKAKTEEKKLRKKKKIGWTPKKGIFEFWSKNCKQNFSLYFSFVLALKIIDTQNLFWSVFLITHKKNVINHQNQPKWRFRRAGTSLICSSLICSFRSNQMSDCERFDQIPQDKWVTVSKSLRSLRGNEQPWATRSGHSRQMSDPERFAQVDQRKWANEQFAQKNLAKKI